MLKKRRHVQFSEPVIKEEFKLTKQKPKSPSKQGKESPVRAEFTSKSAKESPARLDVEKEVAEEWIKKELVRIEKEQAKQRRDSSSKELSARDSGRSWTDEEHELFLNAIRTHGKDWPKITEAMPGWTRAQLCSHGQNFRKRCAKDPNTPGAELALILEGK